MYAFARRTSSPLLAALLLAATSRVLAQQPNPAEEERLKKLDAGSKVIDVSKYPAEQQQAYKLFVAKCATCHVLARGVNTEMVLPGEWERYIKRMMYKPNSGISGDEGKILYRFVVYDGSARKGDLLKKRLAEMPAAERGPVVEKIKGVNPSFTAP